MTRAALSIAEELEKEFPKSACIIRGWSSTVFLELPEERDVKLREFVSYLNDKHELLDYDEKPLIRSRLLELAKE